MRARIMHITRVLALLVVARARRRCFEYSMAMPWCGPRPLRNGTADAMRALAQLASLAASAQDRRTARAPTGHARVLARARAPKKWARVVAPASALLAASPRAPASRGRHRIAVHAGDGSGDGRATRSTSATTRRFLDGTFETAPTLVSVVTGITHPPTADFSNQKTSRRAGA